MEAADFLLEPVRSGIGRRAVAEVLLLGGFCGALSFWVARFRLSYAVESLAHGMLPGLVLASLAGAPLLLGGAGGVLLAAALVALAARDPRIGADSATAVVVTGLFGLGALLALSPEAPARLEELLFGDLLAVSDTDLVAAAGAALLGGCLLAALHRPLCAVAFDEGTAGALGLRPDAIRLVLMLTVASAVAVAVQAIGSLLVLGVLVAPAVAAGHHEAPPGAAILFGAGAAVLAGVVGLYGSHHLGIAAGASVTLALCLAAAAGASRTAGLRPRAARPGARESR